MIFEKELIVKDYWLNICLNILYIVVILVIDELLKEYEVIYYFM